MSILFICYGNTCRSPMAEGLAKLFLDKNERIESAGLVPVLEGAAPEAVEVLKAEFNIDISQHKTRSIADVKLENFDHIIILDVYVFEALKKSYPSFLGVFMLWDIPDPFGKGVGSFRKTAERIRDEIQKHLYPLSST